MGRWVVRFCGSASDKTVAALEERDIETRQLDHFFPERAPTPSVTVVVQAAGEDDAKRRVREVLERHGDFSGFEAMPFVDPV